MELARDPSEHATTYAQVVVGNVSITAESAEVPDMHRGCYARYIKRYFDIVFAGLFLLLVAVWLFPLIALIIRCESPGPALFRQKRVGRHGLIFECLKFRTMIHAPNAPFKQAAPSDERVTRVGRVLRRHNLDELPQFINVFRGDMSVVGPRPHVPELDQIYSEELRHYRKRNMVAPGVTGLAQISGHRGETRTLRDMAMRVRLDLFYLRRYNFMLDLRTIMTTIVRSVRGDRSAY